jgi:hypothetical protein
VLVAAIAVCASGLELALVCVFEAFSCALTPQAIPAASNIPISAFFIGFPLYSAVSALARFPRVTNLNPFQGNLSSKKCRGG